MHPSIFELALCPWPFHRRVQQLFVFGRTNMSSSSSAHILLVFKDAFGVTISNFSSKDEPAAVGASCFSFPLNIESCFSLPGLKKPLLLLLLKSLAYRFRRGRFWRLVIRNHLFVRWKLLRQIFFDIVHRRCCFSLYRGWCLGDRRP